MKLFDKDMKQRIFFLTIILTYSVTCFGCAPYQYTTLSQVQVDNIRTINLSFEAQNDTIKVIDIGGSIRDSTYTKQVIISDELKYKLLGIIPIVGLGFAEISTNNNIKKALGGNTDAIAQQVEKNVATEIISNGMFDAFSKKLNECSYLTFDEITQSNTNTQTKADNVIEIVYTYGIGVSEKYPPHPAIVAKISVFDSRTNQLLNENKIYSDITQLYMPPHVVPSLDTYTENNAQLFIQDLREAAYYIGERIANTYTIYGDSQCKKSQGLVNTLK